MNWYNEIDPYAAQWLRNLMAAGLIPPGVVDERDVRNVCPADLSSYTQCHFFAGIGGWSRALQIAAWPADRPVWTGSCPCQPFSVAGKAGGFADERHLWPYWHWLISVCHPPTIFGEQVASALAWLDLVSFDLEASGYAFGAADIGAAGVGAPHIRQRCWFVADAMQPTGEWGAGSVFGTEAASRKLGNTATPGLQGSPWSGGDGSGIVRSFASEGRWACDWLPCTDGKARPVEPGTFPLVDGLSFKLGSGSTLEGKSRAAMLRAYGNAVVPQVAATFIAATMEWHGWTATRSSRKSPPSSSRQSLDTTSL